MNKRDLYQGKNGLFLLLRIACVTEMILMLYASLFACVRVPLVLCVFAQGCFADQMHLLFNSPSQQAALTKNVHAPARARLHNLRHKHTEWEKNMEIRPNICRLI